MLEDVYQIFYLRSFCPTTRKYLLRDSGVIKVYVVNEILNKKQLNLIIQYLIITNLRTRNDDFK